MEDSNKSNNSLENNLKNLTINDLIKSEIEQIKKDAESNKDVEIKSGMSKYLTIFRCLSALKIMKEDNKPVEIIEGLYIGSFGAASHRENLIHNKITHIVKAAMGIKNYFEDMIIYLELNLLDSAEEDIKKHFNASGEFIHNCIENKGNVLVHCHAGISRSSTIILSYLIKYKKMKFEDALKLCKSKREKIKPNPGFVKQLKEYEEELAKEEQK